MGSLGPKAATAIAVAAGGGGWLLVSHVAHRREAWDSPLFFSWLLPSLLLVAAVLGFLVPERAWRWGFAPFAAQAVVVFAQNPEGSLLPLGLVLFALFGAVASVPARVGAATRRRLQQGR